jgi:hypothetical protein
MATEPARFAHAFPHNDPVARFIVAMSMARNDLRYAMELTVAANREDRAEFTYHARLAMAHFFDAIEAFESWNKLKEIQSFVAGMPQPGRDQLKLARSNLQRVGHEAIEHTRNRTLHYPCPSSRYPQLDGELRGALKAMGEEDVTLVVRPQDDTLGPGYYRLQFADHVALTIAMHKHEPERYRQQVADLQAGAAGFVNFATVAWQHYMASRGLEAGDLPAP